MNSLRLKEAEKLRVKLLSSTINDKLRGITPSRRTLLKGALAGILTGTLGSELRHAYGSHANTTDILDDSIKSPFGSFNEYVELENIAAASVIAPSGAELSKIFRDSADSLLKRKNSDDSLAILENTTNLTFPNTVANVLSDLALKEVFAHATEPLGSNGESNVSVSGAISSVGDDGWVYVPVGTYSPQFSIPNDRFILFGAGWGSIIDPTTTTTPITVTGDDVVIRDLQVVGNSGGGASAQNINLTAGSRCLLYNLFLNGADQHCVRIVGATDYMIVNCYLFDPDDVGIFMGGKGRVYHNKIEQCGSFGIQTGVTPDDSIINGNLIDGTGNDGIQIAAADENFVVVGNRVTNWTNSGIDDQSGTSTVVGNDTT